MAAAFIFLAGSSNEKFALKAAPVAGKRIVAFGRRGGLPEARASQGPSIG
jgi:hypothetical protein